MVRKQRKPAGISVLLLSLLALGLLLNPYGIWQYSVSSGQLAQLKEENARLEAANQDLRQKIDRLENDPEYIEAVARREFGLLKKNELIFDFSRR